jgi:hypothetical protein
MFASKAKSLFPKVKNTQSFYYTSFTSVKHPSLFKLNTTYNKKVFNIYTYGLV